MTALVLLPVALALLATGAGLAWPLAYRAGLHSPHRDDYDPIPDALPTLVQQPDRDDGYRGRHRWGIEPWCPAGAATQVRLLRALREPTQEFKAIIATNYRSGGWPLIGRPPQNDRPADLPGTPSRVEDQLAEVST